LSKRGSRSRLGGCALPIANERAISQPYIVALMMEAVDLKPEDKMLGVGTGSDQAENES
jgi:protein-L-isoaspartate O-methyltransferase